jgi:hypothetical protein
VTQTQAQGKPTDDPGLRMKLRGLAERVRRRVLGKAVESEGHHAQEEKRGRL